MNQGKILIIEDDSILRETLYNYLVQDGFEVVVSSNGEEGARFAKEKSPDLILLDIILPKKDGFEVIKEIKANSETKNIPVVLLTNLGSLSDIERALALGASTYLVKSDYKLHEIVEKIKEILQKDRVL